MARGSRKGSSARGKAFEKKCMGFWQAKGWECERANPKLMFIGPGKCITRAHDFFGCVDMIAVHRYTPKVAFIQFTLGDASPRLKKLNMVLWNPSVHLVQLWKRMPNKRDVRIHRLVRPEPNVVEWVEQVLPLGNLPDFIFM